MLGSLVLKILDMISLGFFTLEFLLRLFFSPNKKIFMMDPLNFVDFIAIAPFYFAILLEEFQDLQIIGKASKLIRVLRLMRILRIFKMVRHFVGLQSLCYTIYQAYKVKYKVSSVPGASNFECDDAGARLDPCHVCCHCPHVLQPRVCI